MLMHNARLADPLDPVTKALRRMTSKRLKTDEDHVEIARLEHAAGMYFDRDIGPYLPGENMARCLRDGAKLTKAGLKIARGVVISTDVNPVAYDGPRDLDGLWADENFRFTTSVKVTTSRTMRTRPRFAAWACAAEGIADPHVIDLSELQQVATTAGQMIGIGDFRPRYGRFTATVQEAR